MDLFDLVDMWIILLIVFFYLVAYNFCSSVSSQHFYMTGKQFPGQLYIPFAAINKRRNAFKIAVDYK